MLKKQLKLHFSTIISLIILLTIISSTYSISVIPNENGFGMDTPAGRGGDIYKITNLNTNGDGSLKECIDASGARTCIFEVSGTIDITEHLKITDPYITIAGQTAPSPGITLKGAGIVIQASDVLIQHIRVRVGDLSDGPAYDDRDAIKIESKYGDIKNVVIDHVSASWALDEVFSTWSYEGKLAEKITVTNSIFAEALYDSYHPDGAHSMGALIGKNTQDLLFSKNILAFNNYRNPLIRDDSTDIIVANNYIYNPGVGSKSKIYFGTTGDNNVPMRATVVGNYFTPNPDEYYDNVVYVESGSASSFSLYVDDNNGPLGTSDDWASVMGRTDSSIRETSPPVTIPGLSFMSSTSIRDYLYDNAGARPTDRDAVDKRVISNIESGKGSIIDSQNEVGGWPTLEVNHRTISLPSNPNGDDDNDSYTNLEELLHEYSYWVEHDINSEPGNSESSIIPETTPEPTLDVNADTTAPVIESTTSTSLSLGTTQTTLKVTTDELAYCHYDDREDIDYLDQKYRFDDFNTQNHETIISELIDGETYTYYVRCKDLETPNNYNEEDYVITFSVSNQQEEPVVIEPPTDLEINDTTAPEINDTTAPVILSSLPNTNLVSGTTQVDLEIVTDELAYCHYDDEPNIHYLDQSFAFENTISLTHSNLISNLVDGETYTYYVRCKDLETLFNYNMQDYVIIFSVNDENQTIETVTDPVVTTPTTSSSSSGGGSSSRSRSSSISLKTEEVTTSEDIIETIENENEIIESNKNTENILLEDTANNIEKNKDIITDRYKTIKIDNNSNSNIYYDFIINIFKKILISFSELFGI
ncbi:MAG: hypothetical protein PF569_02620 [Candidatus Woesearchaeota archaeon]|nr:hypothetical protein [Candidatus Woesearchaeota archaeon]